MHTAADILGSIGEEQAVEVVAGLRLVWRRFRD